jgi:HAL2 family 3'(2'),5'-bisphosphate nucleotidase
MVEGGVRPEDPQQSAHFPLTMTDAAPVIDVLSAMSPSRVLAAMTLSVRRAARLTARLQGRALTLAKSDASPVTVADFAAQALIGRTLCEELGLDASPAAASSPAAFRMVGEEDSSSFDSADGARVLEDVVAALNEEAAGGGAGAGAGASSAATAAARAWSWTRESVVAALSTGRYEAGASGSSYFMCDPIDGTKGFVAPYPSPRHGHYAVGLALMASGGAAGAVRPVAAVIACPHLPWPRWSPAPPEPAADAAAGLRRGCLFSALEGGGAFAEPLDGAGGAGGERARLRTSAAEDGPSLVLAESFDPSHGDRGVSRCVALALSMGAGAGAGAVRIDSMSKYGLLARGDAHVYMRVPAAPPGTPGQRLECAWDHAMGALLVAEAGGVVSDARGRPLDWAAGKGRALAESYGIVAASSAAVHARAIAALAEFVSGAR